MESKNNILEIFDKANIIKDLKEKEPYDFYYDYLLGQDIWYFLKQDIPNASQHYDRFKKHISKKLNIHFHNISIIGSAKTRFSLSPDGKFSEFRDILDVNTNGNDEVKESDLDIVLVSDELFNEIWKSFRKISKNKIIRDYNKKTSEIFRGFISIKDTDEIYENDYIKQWISKISSLKADIQTIFHIYVDFNYRIYKNWEAVEDYHIDGIKKLKENIKDAK